MIWLYYVWLEILYDNICYSNISLLRLVSWLDSDLESRILIFARVGILVILQPVGPVSRTCNTAGAWQPYCREVETGLG